MFETVGDGGEVGGVRRRRRLCRGASGEVEVLLAEAGEAAQLLDYYDRERKPVWWTFFDRLERTPEELLERAKGDVRPAR